MERLLAGSPLHTVGRLDATSLAREAGVSRQDLYRTYRNLLDEFRDHLERLRSVPAGDRLHPEASGAQLREITERAARYRAERDAARRERDANASRIIYLADQNRQLHEALGSLRGVVALFSEPTGGPAESSPM